MAKSRCQHVLPADCADTVGPEPHACLLAQGHAGEHLAQVSGARFISWRPKWEDECEEDDCGEFRCSCSVFSYVPSGAANGRIAHEGPG